MSGSIIKEFDAYPVEYVKRQFDEINAKGDLQLKEVRGPGVHLDTWKKYPCYDKKRASCTDESYCENSHISIKMISVKAVPQNKERRKNWKLIPPNLAVLAVHKGERTYIINDNTYRDFVDEEIFEDDELERVVIRRMK